jgi:hypothetical protein
MCLFQVMPEVVPGFFAQPAEPFDLVLKQEGLRLLVYRKVHLLMVRVRTRFRERDVNLEQLGAGPARRLHTVTFAGIWTNEAQALKKASNRFRARFDYRQKP